MPKLYLNESDQTFGKKFWREKGLTTEDRSEVIVLHPGSGSKRKVWPSERFLDLVDYLRERLHSRLLIVLGPAEGAEIRKTFERMEREPGDTVPILEQKDFLFCNWPL